jgi:hypothetical protein
MEDEQTSSPRSGIIQKISRAYNQLLSFFRSTSRKLRDLFNKPLIDVLRALQPVGLIAIFFLGIVTISPPWDIDKRVLPIYIFTAIGATLGVLLISSVKRERYSALFASIFGWIPVFLGSLSYPFWYWYASGYSNEIGSEFFHAAADILPVLLLATVLDVRRTNELEGKQLIPPIAAVFFGELAALNALAFANGGTVDNFAVVSASLVTATLALVIAVMADLSPSEERHPQESGSQMRKTFDPEQVTTHTGSTREPRQNGSPDETGPV